MPDVIKKERKSSEKEPMNSLFTKVSEDKKEAFAEDIKAAADRGIYAPILFLDRVL